MKKMKEHPQHRKTVGSIFVPHNSWAVCFVIALLAPYVASMPDIPFGNWHVLIDDGSGKFDLGFFATGSLFVLFINALAISPAFFAGVVLEKSPLAYWLSLAAYLGATIMGYGMVYRVLGGSGLEVLAVLVLAAFAATGGAAAGFLLDKVIKDPSVQLSIVRIAFVVAVLGSLSWSVIDASTYDERKLAWKENQPGRRQNKDVVDIYSAPRAGTKSQVACLGRASADASIRLFTESDCTRVLRGKYFTNGECLKEQGGSYSWDLRWMNG